MGSFLFLLSCSIRCQISACVHPDMQLFYVINMPYQVKAHASHFVYYVQFRDWDRALQEEGYYTLHPCYENVHPLLYCANRLSVPIIYYWGGH